MNSGTQNNRETGSSWKLEGYDTFSSEPYSLGGRLDGLEPSYPSRETALAGAHKRLADLEAHPAQREQRRPGPGWHPGPGVRRSPGRAPGTGAPVNGVPPWVLVDCEARGTSPVNGVLTEFGAVHYASRATFHGRLYEAVPDPANPAVPLPGARLASDAEVAGVFTTWLTAQLGSQRPVLVSDNPAYDFMWIAGMFDRARVANPFGHSGRRISDFWAGLHRDWSRTQDWKRLRRTAHDHNPVHDAQGNAEALEQILRLARIPDAGTHDPDRGAEPGR